MKPEKLAYYRAKVPCPDSGSMIARSAMSAHKKTVKCKKLSQKKRDQHNTNDKTGKLEGGQTGGVTSPPVIPESITNNKIVQEFNFNTEFDNMSTKVNPKDKNKGKDDDYECSSCRRTFNHFGENKSCPMCGVELE